MLSTRGRAALVLVCPGLSPPSLQCSAAASRVPGSFPAMLQLPDPCSERLLCNINDCKWWGTEQGVVCFPNKWFFFVRNCIISWLRIRDGIAFPQAGSHLGRVVFSTQHRLASLSPLASCTHLPERATSRCDQKTLTLLHDILLFRISFFSPLLQSCGLVTLPHPRAK